MDRRQRGRGWEQTGESSADGRRHGNRGPDVLLVEPSARDARLVSCGLARRSVSVEVVEDGETAIERLTDGCTTGIDEALPQLVVLGFDVERVDGVTILHAIKSSPRLRTIPVVVLDGTEDPGARSREARRASDLGANAHLAKPEDVDAYVALVERLAVFWFRWASIPTECLYTDSP